MTDYKDAKYQFPASGITSGTLNSARISEASVTQHVTATDLQPVKSDITALALREATNESSAAFNLPNSFIETFTDDTNLGLQTTGDRLSGYWCTVYSNTDYDQTFGTARQNTDVISGTWTNALTNDTISSPSGTRGDYPLSYINYIYDLAKDWKIKIFGVTRATGNNDITEDYVAHNALITTDTSVAAGVDTATSSVDGRVFRHSQTSSDSGANDFLLKDPINEWGDVMITASYASTIGSDNSSVNYSGPAGGHQQIDCDSFSSPITCSNYTASNQDSYGWLVEYDRAANTIVIKYATNTAWTSFASDKTTFSNVPETGRFLFVPTSGGSQEGRTTYWSTTYNGVTDANKGYAIDAAESATGTLIQSANTVGSSKTEVGGTMLYKDNAGTATLGSANDLAIYFTCDGGSNWTEAASYNAITPTYSSGIKQVRLGKTTCTGGTDVRYKAVWANQADGSKETQLHGIGINY